MSAVRRRNFADGGSRLAANIAAGGQHFLLAGRRKGPAEKLAADLDGHAEAASVDDVVDRWTCWE